MKNGTVIVTKYRPSKHFFWNLLSKLIVFFTGMPYTHVEIYCDYYMYGSTLGGPRKTKEIPKNVIFLEPKIDLTQKQQNFMKRYLESKLGNKGRYNILKLIVLSFVYPTRWFWKWIGWVPFQNDVFGVVCSVYVDEAYKAAGIDLLPKEYEEYTAPGDFFRADKLTKIKDNI